jgi:hypothetical protein
MVQDHPLRYVYGTTLDPQSSTNFRLGGGRSLDKAIFNISRQEWMPLFVIVGGPRDW